MPKTAPPETVQRLPERPLAVARQAAAAIRAELGAATRVIWFGSWPRGDALERSDIDLAVDRQPGIGPEELARARARLDELPTLYRVDLLARVEVGDRLRDEIDRHGIDL